MTPTLHLLLSAVKEANRALSNMEPAVSRTAVECLAQENRLLRAELAELKAKRVGR